MPSKQTEHFALSQWEPDDKVLREDFNRDNRTIDEVLFRANNRELQLIKEFEITEDTQEMDVSFPELDWTEWNRVHVLVYLAKNSSDAISCHIQTTKLEEFGKLRVPTLLPGG